MLDMLIRTLEKGELSHQVLQQVYADPGLSSRDLAFINRLYSGTLEKLVYLDHVIGSFSSIPVRKMKPAIRNILRMSLYQMEFMDAVPVPVSIDEGVKLARKKGFSGLTGFVNGILRRADREAGQLSLPPYVKACAPEWIYDLITEQYGKEDAEAFFRAVQQTEEGTRIRLCLSGSTKEGIITSLQEDGCVVTPLEGLEDCCSISGFDRLTSLRAFQNGEILIQNPSSVMAARTAVEQMPDPELVVDVCAAPGGKSLYVAEKCPGARVIARDLTSQKTERIMENARRMKIRNVEAQVYDARIPDPELKERADVVICDLPCSGLGVISRKPDILYRLKKQDLEDLALLQREILDAARMYVKPGGVLVYSTCTVNRQENEENAEWFVGNSGGEFSMISERQYLPGRDPFDGFYVASFRKA